MESLQGGDSAHQQKTDDNPENDDIVIPKDLEQRSRTRYDLIERYVNVLLNKQTRETEESSKKKPSSSTPSQQTRKKAAREKVWVMVMVMTIDIRVSGEC